MELLDVINSLSDFRSSLEEGIVILSAAFNKKIICN